MRLVEIVAAEQPAVAAADGQLPDTSWLAVVEPEVQFGTDAFAQPERPSPLEPQQPAERPCRCFAGSSDDPAWMGSVRANPFANERLSDVGAALAGTEVRTRKVTAPDSHDCDTSLDLGAVDSWPLFDATPEPACSQSQAELCPLACKPLEPQHHRRLEHHTTVVATSSCTERSDE